MKETKLLGTESIGKLLMKYSVPAVIAMLVNAIYNVIDRIFIGQYAGENALAGLTVAFPVMMIIFAFASLIGAGGSALLAIKLGEKDEKGAIHVFGNTISFGLIITIITLISIYLNLEELLLVFGGTAEVLGYASTYMKIILGGFIFQMISFILNSSVRTEGKPILSMMAMMASAFMNIILDYIFIGIMDMGVAGAAYATIIGQFAGLSILLSFYIRGKSVLKISLKDLVPDIKLIGNIIAVGFSTFISTVGTSIAMVFMNRALSEYGGVSAITSMGAINSLFTFFIMPIMGITQGMQPIIGYNFGAKNLTRVNDTLKYGLLIGVVFSSIVFAILELFPNVFVGLFLDSGSETISVAINGLRIYLAMLPIISINLMGVAYYQSTAKGSKAVIFGMLRQLFLLVPLVLVLPKFFGLNGVWVSVPIADAISVIATGIFLIIDVKQDSGYTSNSGAVVFE